MAHSYRVSEGTAAGIAAYERNDWKAGYELLSEAIAGTPDDATALDALSECCWWLERTDEAIEHRERAYGIHYRNGDWSKAAGAALKLGGAYATTRQQPAVAAGWRQRASELLEGKPLSAAHLHLKLGIAQRMTDVDGCLPLIDEVIGLAQQLGDHDQEMLAIGLKGLKLVCLGRLDEGLPLQDAALAAAVGGELTPLSTVLAYCWLISSCDNLGDIERANEWSDSALRYCDRAAIPSFPGVCRLHRSRMLRLRGAWHEAEAEAFRAAEALGTTNPGFYALALCEVAELRRRRGDVDGARDLARQAVAMGRTPQVALARIEWEADGPEAAMYRLESALHDPITDRFARAKLIPTYVEAAIACGKAESAEEHVTELESLAEVGHTNVLRGAGLARPAAARAPGSCGRASRAGSRGRRLVRGRGPLRGRARPARARRRAPRDRQPRWCAL